MVDKQCFTIGRKKDNDFVVANDKVGKEHACILWERNRYYVRDLDSLNGTRVNGTLLEHDGIREIRHGDRIVFADEEFDFEILGR